MNQYDVVIHMNEPRYWALLLASLLAGLALHWRFKSLDEDRKDRALIQMGWVLIALQVGYQLVMALDPAFEWTVHRSLPLHFCGINIWLVSLNCFWRNRTVFLFTAFMGTIGGFHAILTPQLTVGDDLPILIHYYINHAALVFVPVVMSQVYGMRFPKWGWVKAYFIAAAASTLMAGVNHALNTWCPSDVLANYMYMTEPPKADNPFVFHDLAWPWYVLPLHAALVLHLLVLNALYRWRFPASGPDAVAAQRGEFVEGKLHLLQ
ncbi:MAG: YwaF family protein [Flavobacteriales bacterium]